MPATRRSHQQSIFNLLKFRRIPGNVKFQKMPAFDDDSSSCRKCKMARLNLGKVFLMHRECPQVVVDVPGSEQQRPDPETGPMAKRYTFFKTDRSPPTARPTRSAWPLPSASRLPRSALYRDRAGLHACALPAAGLASVAPLRRPPLALAELGCRVALEVLNGPCFVNWASRRERRPIGRRRALRCRGAPCVRLLVWCFLRNPHRVGDGVFMTPKRYGVAGTEGCKVCCRLLK